jgi:hypothetical protein
VFWRFSFRGRRKTTFCFTKQNCREIGIFKSCIYDYIHCVPNVAIKTKRAVLSFLLIKTGQLNELNEEEVSYRVLKG